MSIEAPRTVPRNIVSSRASRSCVRALRSKKPSAAVTLLSSARYWTVRDGCHGLRGAPAHHLEQLLSAGAFVRSAVSARGARILSLSRSIDACLRTSPADTAHYAPG